MEHKAASLSVTSRAGRQSAQLRSFACERSPLNRSDGSSKWTQEGTSVLAAVYGPRQAQLRNEDAEKAVVEVILKPRSGLQEFKDRDFEATIRHTLEAVIPLAMHPRTSIMIVIQVLQDDGGLLSCCLNAACAALVDAGIPMTSQFASVTCALTPEGSILVDPTSKEEDTSIALLCIALPFHFDFTSKGDKSQSVVEDLALVNHSWGEFSHNEYLDIFEICRKGCGQVAEFSRLFLKQGLVA